MGCPISRAFREKSAGSCRQRWSFPGVPLDAQFPPSNHASHETLQAPRVAHKSRVLARVGQLERRSPRFAPEKIMQKTLQIYGSIVKLTLLVKVEPGRVTVIGPVVAPAGTVVTIALRTAVKVAAVPLNETPVAAERLFPRIVTLDPTTPAAGFGVTNAGKPSDHVKTVPTLPVPPYAVLS